MGKRRVGMMMMMMMMMMMIMMMMMKVDFIDNQRQKDTQNLHER